MNTNRKHLRRALSIAVAVPLLALVSSCAGTGSISIARREILEAALQESPSKPVMIVDLDDTVVDGGSWNSIRLALGLFYGSILPFDQAAEQLREFERDWNIVFVTARPSFVDDSTVAWLDRHNFPRAPVVFSSKLLFRSESRENYKTASIAEIKNLGLTPRLGVGDKASDIGAYERNGLTSLLLLSGTDDRDLDTTLKRFAVTKIDQNRIAGHVDTVYFDTATAWTMLAERVAVLHDSLGSSSRSTADGS